LRICQLLLCCCLPDTAVQSAGRSYGVWQRFPAALDLATVRERRVLCNSPYFLAFQMGHNLSPQYPSPCRKQSFWTGSDKGDIRSGKKKKLLQVAQLTSVMGHAYLCYF
jgi:hypothetical protein